MGELHLEVLVDRMMPRVQGRRQRRQAAGRLPRDDPARRPRATGASSARPAARASTATRSSSSSRTEKGAGLRVRRQDRRRHDPARVHQVGRRRASARRSRRGIYAGYPMVDVKATLFDGSYHDVDSSEMAFKIAGSMAVKDAVAQGRARAILEPIMRVEVDDARGVHGRRHRRPQQPPRPDRGDGVARQRRRSSGRSSRSPRCSATRRTCASMTQGRGELLDGTVSHYAEVPASLASELVAKTKV